MIQDQMFQGVMVGIVPPPAAAAAGNVGAAAGAISTAPALAGGPASGTAGQGAGQDISFGEPEDKMMHKMNEILTDTFMAAVGLKDQLHHKEQEVQEARSQMQRAMELGTALSAAGEGLAAQKLEAEAAATTMAAHVVMLSANTTSGQASWQNQGSRY